jgi:hypothetical protein
MASHQNADYFPPTQGGRTTPPVLVSENGTYRPHIVIGDPMQRNAITVDNEIREAYLGLVFVSGPTDVRFGELIETEAALMYYPKPEHSPVVPGATFTIREGPKIVGYGLVKDVCLRNDA